MINSVCSVKGFGLSMSYDDRDRPLVINSGEIKEIGFVLLSSALESDKKIRLDIIDGEEIAGLNKNEFYLPSNGEIKGFIKIKAPDLKEKKEIYFSDNDYDNEYLVTLSVKDISSSDNSGSVGFSFSSSTSFIVKVQKPEGKLPETKPDLNLFFAIILIIAILFLILLIYALIRIKKAYIKDKKIKHKKSVKYLNYF